MQTLAPLEAFSRKESRKPTSLKSGFQWNQNLERQVANNRLKGQNRKKQMGRMSPLRRPARPRQGEEVLAGQSRGREGEESGSGRITPIGPDRFRSQLER